MPVEAALTSEICELIHYFFCKSKLIANILIKSFLMKHPYGNKYVGL